MTTLILPYPPSSNRYWRNFRGRMVRSAEAEAYNSSVGWYCNLKGIAPVAGSVAVVMNFYRPAKMGDLDNRIKICLDALQGYAYENDKQIVEIHAYRREDKKEPRVEIEITELAAPAVELARKAVRG